MFTDFTYILLLKLCFVQCSWITHSKYILLIEWFPTINMPFLAIFLPKNKNQLILVFSLSLSIQVMQALLQHRKVNVGKGQSVSIEAIQSCVISQSVKNM